MPNLDGTGPQGQGSMTGRRRGRCRDSENSNQQNQSNENKEIVSGLGRGGRSQRGGAFGKGQKVQADQGSRRGFGRRFGKNKSS